MRNARLRQSVLTIPKVICSSAFILLLFGVTGCRKVTPTDLAGTWTITEDSRTILSASTRNASPKIVLWPNGQFVANDLPVFTIPPEQEKVGNGRGEWKIISEHGRQQLLLIFSERNGVTQQGGYGYPLDFDIGYSTLGLYYYLGDPDEGRRITLIKR
ncbi:MAG TPA: hypothetical protein VGE85_09655 [Terracidiphilus sp.]|jgi:hypothetical protein